MICAACHHEMVKKMGEIDLRIKGKLYLVKNVYFAECPACGEKVISSKVSEDLFKKIKNKEFTEEIFKISVLDGTYG